jgi:hypothetical protein
MKGLDFAAVAPGDQTVDDDDEEEEERVEEEEEEEEEDEEVSSESESEEDREDDKEDDEEESSEEEDDGEEEADEKLIPDVKPKTVKQEAAKPQEEIAGFVKKSGLANTEYAGINVSIQIQPVGTFEILAW